MAWFGPAVREGQVEYVQEALHVGVHDDETVHVVEGGCCAKARFTGKILLASISPTTLRIIILQRFIFAFPRP